MEHYDFDQNYDKIWDKNSIKMYFSCKIALNYINRQ